MKTTKDAKAPRTPFFNFRGWLGWDGIIQNTTMIKSLVVSLFVLKQPTRTESFEEALVRLNLSEADIQNRAQQSQRQFFIFFIAAIILFLYALVLFVQQAYAAALGTFGLTAFLLAQAFRYHFILFQITQRKLGCSLREWFREGVLGMRSNPNREIQK
jgi:intracellular multiplication protein IcmV